MPTVPSGVKSLRPVGQRVIVEVIHAAPQTSGGLYRPHFEKFLENEGIVIAVSEEVTNLSPGDRVILPRYEGMTKLPSEDHRRYIIIDTAEIEGVIYEEDS